MKQVEQIVQALTSHIESTLVLPSGVETVEDFVVGPPTDVNKRQIAVYLATGNRTVAEAAETVIVQAQLPGVLDPMFHHSCIAKTLMGFAPEEVHGTSLAYGYNTYYPGQVQDGGMSSFIVYEVTILAENDDCIYHDDEE